MIKNNAFRNDGITASTNVDTNNIEYDLHINIQNNETINSNVEGHGTNVNNENNNTINDTDNVIEDNDNTYFPI
jgi:hypothetical protein